MSKTISKNTYNNNNNNNNDRKIDVFVYKTLVILITDLHLVLLVIGFEQVFLNDIDQWAPQSHRPKSDFEYCESFNFCVCNYFEIENQKLI